MQRTNIYLDEDQLQALKHLAAEERQSVADLVRQAVDEYLAKRLAGDAEWQQRLDQLMDRIRSRVPESVTPEEIEADISAAREEVRQAHRARRRRHQRLGLGPVEPLRSPSHGAGGPGGKQVRTSHQRTAACRTGRSSTSASHCAQVRDHL